MISFYHNNLISNNAPASQYSEFLHREKGMQHTVSPQALDPLKYNEFCAALEAAGFVANLKRPDEAHLTIYETDTAVVYMLSTTITFFSTTMEEMDKVLGVFKPFSSLESPYILNSSIQIGTYFMNKGVVDSTFNSIEPGDIEEIYPQLYPEYDIEILTKQFKKSKENILLLYGEPGTGKTSFIKHFIRTTKSVCYVKDPNVLEHPSFWSFITDEDYEALIFDDLDGSLSPRTEKKEGQFMSQLLSYTDGMFRNSTKIIITTNLKMQAIDEALVRPGRMFDFLNLGPLTVDEARDFWVDVIGLDSSIFNETFGNNRMVTQAELMSEVNRLKDGIKCRDYIKRGNKNYTVKDKFDLKNIQIGTGKKVGF